MSHHTQHLIKTAGASQKVVCRSVVGCNHRCLSGLGVIPQRLGTASPSPPAPSCKATGQPPNSQGAPISFHPCHHGEESHSTCSKHCGAAQGKSHCLCESPFPHLNENNESSFVRLLLEQMEYILEMLGTRPLPPLGHSWPERCDQSRCFEG